MAQTEQHMNCKSVAAESCLVLLLTVMLFGCVNDHAKSGEGGGNGTTTEKHNGGWKWAEQRKVRSDAQCKELEDTQMRAGCEAYVVFVSAQIETSP